MRILVVSTKISILHVQYRKYLTSVSNKHSIMSIFCIDSSHRNNTPLKTVLHIFEDVRRRLICHITISINIVIDSIVASLYAMKIGRAHV